MPVLDRQTLARALGDSLERLIKNAKSIEEWPLQYRYRCLSCEDKGIELSWPREDPAMSYHKPAARPCIHCAKGTDILSAWRDVGPWRGLLDQTVESIMQQKCAHR